MMESIAAMPPAGGYFSLTKIIVMLVLASPWLYVSPWVHKDAKRVRTRQSLWSGAVLGVGAMGVLFWFIIPEYVVGLLIYVVLTGGVLTAYVVHRNGRVIPERRILTGEHIASIFARRAAEKVEVVTRIKVYDSHGKLVPAPSAEDAELDEIDAYNLSQDLLYEILWRRASEAELSPAGEQAKVRMIIDGVAVNHPPLSLTQSESIIQHLKPVAGLNVEDRRRPQQGQISVDLAGKPIDITLASAGTTGGQRMLFRVVQEVVRTDLDSLGMSEGVLQRLCAMNESGKGLIIVSGRRANGVTSTLYSLLRKHDAFMRHLVTLESKVVVDLENITQHSYGEDSALPEALASALRRQPDVIVVDRCGDRQTADQIRDASAEKTILLGSRAADSFVALAKWVKACGNAAAAVENLQGITCQVLIRKLCPNCREAYRPDPQLLAKANIPAQKVDRFYRSPTRPLTNEKGQPIVCPTCQGSGYFGRTAVFELLEVTDEIRQLVLAGASLTQIKTACRKNKMLYLQEQALRRVIEGITSIKEVLRVTQSAKK